MGDLVKELTRPSSLNQRYESKLYLDQMGRVRTSGIRAYDCVGLVRHSFSPWETGRTETAQPSECLLAGLLQSQTHIIFMCRPVVNSPVAWPPLGQAAERLCPGSPGPTSKSRTRTWDRLESLPFAPDRRSSLLIHPDRLPSARQPGKAVYARMRGT